ncbi:MAG: tetratricopeptide repeat protein [Hyphomicrobium sp.]|nr:tetratricopeptide repeat protein [Hyphomicrobium sp.]
MGAGGMEGRPQAKAEELTFVGSQACSSCHAKEYADWKSSQHHAAMQVAVDETVLGDFTGATFTKDGLESTFFKRDGKFWVRTHGPDGKLADFEIRYTFGLYPLQQYLIALPGGRYQALGVAWDSRPKEDGGQRWYHLYPDQNLKPGDPLHWTGIDQNWNYQCAWCHSTNLQKNYDPQSKTFQTTWSEISVGCEACHGPASGHLAWAEKRSAGTATSPTKGFKLTLDERRNVTWPMHTQGQAFRSVPRTSTKEIEVCAGCHARRQQFSSDALGQLFDAFQPSTLDRGLYHSDGQQLDEVFNYGSFVQSKMHAAGVTCSDCHNPHSGKLHKSGNAVCAQCHAAEKFDSADHHHHASSSAGAQCASCHMPTTTYMGVDARHDHSMRIPRPDRSILIGTPNACNKCHTDKSAGWARDAVKAWYPSSKPGFQDFAEAFDLADRRAPGAQSALLRLATEDTASGISRASALARLADFSSPEAVDIAAKALAIDDPAVRTSAIAVIAGTDPATRRAYLPKMLRDRSRLVRMSAARALVGEPEVGLSDDDRAAFGKALAEYIDGQLFNAERPESHANLGNLYRDQGRLNEARAAFLKALDLDRSFAGASVALADLERMAGDERAAEDVLRKGFADNPTSGAIAHALGLSLIRQKRTSEAMSYLSQAASLSPEDPRFSYVLAVALHDTGKIAEATATLKNALARHPYDRDLLLAMITYDIEAGLITSGLERAELLAQLEPTNPQVTQLLASLRNRKRQ